MKTLAEAEKEARALVNKWATGQALTGWVPGSTLVLTGADLVMINQVAAVFEVNSFDSKAVIASIGGTATSSVAGGVIAEGLSFIPGPGWIVKGALMGGKAKAIGEGVITYFKELSPLKDDTAPRR